MSLKLFIVLRTVLVIFKPVSNKHKRDSKSPIERVFAQKHTTHLFKQFLSSSNANALKMFPTDYVEHGSDFKVVDDMNLFFKSKTKHDITFLTSNKSVSLSLPIIDSLTSNEHSLHITKIHPKQRSLYH